MDKSFSVATMYLLTHVALTFFMYPIDIIGSTNTGHWLPVLTSFAVHFTVISVYMKGLSYFKGQDLVEILKSNKIISVIILLPVTIYLIAICVLATRSIAEIITIVYLSKTPLWAVILLFLSISTYMAHLGPRSLFRAGVLIGLIFMPPILMVLLTSFQNVDWRYVFPLYDKQLFTFSFLGSKHFFEGGFAFAGAFVFLGMIPKHLPYKPKKIILSSFILLPLFLLAVYLPILTFGEQTARQFQFPFITCLDTIEFNWIMFDRITIFFLQSLVSFVILLIALLLWESTTIIRKTTFKIKKIYILAVLSVIIYFICVRIPDWNDVQKLNFWSGIIRWYVITVLPTTILIMGLLKKKKLNMN